MKVVIGTRGSALARWQARHVGDRLKELHEIEYEERIIKTTGDKIKDAPLAKIGGKGIFVKELDDAVLQGSVDLAVHSMKDVPVDLPKGLVIAAVPEREETNDALLSSKSLDELPEDAVIGTSSLRRRAQLKHYRPELRIKDIRGNVDTRIRKLREGLYDAIVMAKAGLKRMGFESYIRETLPLDIFTPTVGQGAIAVVARDGSRLLSLLSSLNHKPSEMRVLAERSLLRGVGGGCQIPLGANTWIDGSKLHLTAVMLSQDGSRRIEVREAGQDPVKVGEKAAKRLLDQGGAELLHSSKA